MGPFSFSCYVLLGPRPHLQLSSAKEMNTADTVEVASKVPVWWATAGVGPHQVDHEPSKFVSFL